MFDRESKEEEVTMSSEQQERQAMQYVERSSLLTVRTLLKLLEWSARQALAQDSAYKIGVQKLEELLLYLVIRKIYDFRL